MGDEIEPTLQIRSTKQAMHAEFGCLMWFVYHITLFSISPLKVMKLLPSLTYLKIFPSQTLSFVPHSAQFHVTALTELAKRSTNNYTKKTGKPCKCIYVLYQVQWTSRFCSPSVHVTKCNIYGPQYSESPLCYKGTVQEKGGAEVSWFPLSVSVNVRKCSVV